MLYDNLLDVLKHTHDLGFLETVKIIGDEKTRLESMILPEKTVVFYGELKNEIPELKDHTVGLSRMSILKGYVNFPSFKENSGAIEIKKEMRQGVNSPTEIAFSSSEGHDAHYRFMGENVVNEQINVPVFRGVTWEIEYNPTEKNLSDLQYFNGILGGVEGTFSVISSGKDLKLSIGSGPTDRTVIPFSNAVSGTINEVWRWPLSEVISIMKLGNTGNCTMRFSDAGALEIEIDSGLGVYRYIIPAKS